MAQIQLSGSPVAVEIDDEDIKLAAVSSAWEIGHGTKGTGCDQRIGGFSVKNSSWVWLDALVIQEEIGLSTTKPYWVIVHLDGNPLNCRRSNLDLLTS